MAPNIVRRRKAEPGRLQESAQWSGDPARRGRPRTTRPTPSGCGSAGRRVLVVGGGNVAQRRVPTLIAAGRRSCTRLAGGHPGHRGPGGLGRGPGTAAASRTATSTGPGTSWPRPTTRPSTSGSACSPRQQRLFCVRADDAAAATAFTPATGSHAGDTVAVMGSSAADRDPRRHAGLRDEIVNRPARGRARRHAPPATRPRASCWSAAVPAIPS